MSINWLVLQELPFAVIETKLTELGWQRIPDPTAPEPLIEGELELAAWRLRDLARCPAQLSYTFFPTTSLRALLLEASDEDLPALRAQLERRLPTLGKDEISRLLASDKVLTVLRGIQAASVLLDPVWIEALNQLLGSAHTTVAREARGALVKILSKSAQQGVELLEKLKPGSSALVFNQALFTGLQSVRQRRQALRWLMHQQTQANREIEAVLSAALKDTDWEVRVTAMLAASRLGATKLYNAVKAVVLPAARHEGVDSRDQRVLAALRAAVLARLGGQASHDQPLDPARAAMRHHIARCVTGEAVPVHDNIFLYCHALTTPFTTADTAEHQPATLPPGVTRDLDGYLLEGIELVWIPAVTAWLGDELARAPMSNPIRQVTSAGFFIARYPLGDAAGNPAWFTFEATDAYCHTLSARTGARIRLPRADEWEIAARGTDGRRFPWGNTLPRPSIENASPWGLEAVVGVCAQWCVAHEQRSLLVGDVDQLWCSLRKTAPDATTQATLRVVVE